MNRAYVAARDRILTQLALDDGFWFALVAGPEARPRDRLLRVVRAWCEEHGLPFLLHEGPADELPAVAATLARAPAPGVHWFRADEPSEGDLGRLLLALNERREAYVRGLRGCILVEGRATQRRQLQDLAPDLFSIAVPVPDTGRDATEMEDPPWLSSPLWHILPEAAEEPSRWLERAEGAADDVTRFAALVHALEAHMARREFSRASPLGLRCQELARGLAAAGALTPALTSLQRRAAVWRAALANEAGDAAGALACLALAPEGGDAAAEVEEANARWRLGEHRRALGAWENVLRASIAQSATRPAEVARGALLVLWRGASIGCAEQGLALWDDALRAPGVADALLRDDELAAEAWLRMEQLALYLARADAALSLRLTVSLHGLGERAQRQPRDATPWYTLEALGAFERSAAAGKTTQAVGELARHVEASRRGGRSSPLGELALVAAEMWWTNLAANVAPTPEALSRLEQAIARASSTSGTAALRARLRQLVHHGVIAQVHFLERAGRFADAVAWIDRHDLLGPDATPHHRTVATILRARLRHRLGHRGESIRTLTALLPELEPRGGALTTEQKRNLVCAWRDLGDCFLEDEALESAASAYTTAARYARRYLLQHPDEVAALQDLSMALAPLAAATLQRGDRRRALAIHEEDLEVSRRLVALDPQSVIWRRDLALTLRNGARIHLAAHDIEACQADLSEAKALAEGVLRDDPYDRVAQDLLQSLRHDRAWLAGAFPREASR